MNQFFMKVQKFKTQYDVSKQYMQWKLDLAGKWVTEHIFNKCPLIRGLQLSRYHLNRATEIALVLFFIYLSSSSVSLSEAIPWKLWSRPFSLLVDTGFRKKEVTFRHLLKCPHTDAIFLPIIPMLWIQMFTVLISRRISRKC